ncbi:hypothetical protein KSD_30750 [Ktedonobacter sp. SOSP1-85]|uniref:Os1348 family NHLP clan protein n=1 Tax=Ktedonobacter sp. SOSP1-85 TaxID=2778367 RepID=UPI0019168D33|nr:Os1348 family NHLP clan protein [Ktedonobacter sp. SOSP1-85]GHO75304.1 hypothetical protein KSD_30750 [Ktedonobacter sp. SOSP1-85]
MSWKIINRILGLAAINPAFRQQLQEDPRAALEIQGFELTPDEMEVFKRHTTLPFAQLCQQLFETYAPHNQESSGETIL